MTFSNDGYFLLGNSKVYRVSDGAAVRDDQPTFPWKSTDLAPRGRTKLVVGELVADWDLVEGKVSKLYGSPTGTVRAIEVSRDGRYFASHAAWAVLWEMDPNFATARPLAQGVGPTRPGTSRSLPTAPASW